jgi:hypothetical protein
MTLTLEQLATILGLMVAVTTLGRALVKLGEVLRRLDDLEARHREGITDTRQRLQALELSLVEIRQRVGAPACPPQPEKR